MSTSRHVSGATILSDHPCHLGEGPSYDAASDTAWWFDIVKKTLFEHRFADGETVTHALPFMASQLSFIDPARQLIAAENGLYVRDVASGRLTLAAALEDDNAVTRSNDGRVHPCGALWIGTMGKGAETGAGAIYWFFRGELRLLYPRITIPNAICFSPDGTRAYFADTRDARLMTVETDAATGLPKGEPSLFYDHRGETGGLDGAVMDADGLIWNARWGSGCIDAYGADGKRVRSLKVPALQPSCPSLIGLRGERMLVTSAWEGQDAAMRAKDPDGGKTFVLDEPMRGIPEPRVLIA